MFNPQASIQTIRFDEQRFCLIVDDALVDPDAVVRQVAKRRQDFLPIDFSGYPGIYQQPTDALANSFYDLFLSRLRRHFDARRVLQSILRFSMMTWPLQALRPYQWLCHIDNTQLEPPFSMQATVLYLFRDPGLGGTGFYRPKQAPEAMARLSADSRALEPQEFTARYRIQPGYMLASNDWYERIGSVEARWNRLICYDGGIHHSADTAAPERLVEDPLRGRLTLNGFFTSQRHLR